MEVHITSLFCLMMMFLRMHARMNALIVWRGFDFWTHPRSFPSRPQAGAGSPGLFAEEVFCLFAVEWLRFLLVLLVYCSNSSTLSKLLLFVEFVSFAWSLIICGVFISVPTILSICIHVFSGLLGTCVPITGLLGTWVPITGFLGTCVPNDLIIPDT